ncbi:MAG TPA: VWA domain-containing protein [Vicinamibacterales bacterium]
MPTRLFTAAVLLLLPVAQQQQQPVIRSGVELVRIDVQVSSRNGQPVENLKPDQFEVNIDGKRLPVVALDFVRYNATEASARPAGAAPAPAAPAASPDAASTPGDTARVLILAVDEPSFMTASRQAPMEIVKRIASMASPRDLIGLIAFPGPGVVFSPSLDRAALLEAAQKIDGRLNIPTHNRLQFSVADAIDWTTDLDYRQRIFQRECPLPNDQMCRREVEMMAQEFIGAFQLQAMMSVSGLRNVVDTVKRYPGRKTLIVVSGGFVATDRMGGKPDIRFEADMLGKRAAEANTVIYSLHTDVSFLHAFSSPQAARQLQNVVRNSSLMAGGLEQFTASAGGTVIAVPAGPDKALERILSETSAYYLLGVEPPAEFRDGKLHRIQVKVKQGGTQVRSRSSVIIPKGN